MFKKLALLMIVLLVIGTLLSPHGLAGLGEVLIAPAVLLFVGILLTCVFTGVGLLLAAVFAFVMMILAVSLLPLLIPLLIPIILLSVPLFILWMFCRIVRSIAKA